MKTFILALATFIFSSNFIFAFDAKPGITLVTGKVVTIDLADFRSDMIDIAIYDKAGHKLYSEEINTVDYAKRSFNLKRLPLGSYSIELSTEQSIITKEIDLKKAQIIVHNDVISYKPVSFLKNGTWNVNLLSLNQDTQITIYSSNQTLYSETFTNEMTISKSYNLENLNKGRYYMTINVGENTYEESFVKS